METIDPTVAALHELTDELRRLDVGPREIAEHVTGVLDRSAIGELDLTYYLLEKGFKNERLARAMGTFAAAVKAEYLLKRGKPPLKVMRRGRVVNSYTEMDRQLVDDVFGSWSK
jgi:hypothetical protein